MLFRVFTEFGAEDITILKDGLAFLSTVSYTSIKPYMFHQNVMTFFHSGINIVRRQSGYKCSLSVLQTCTYFQCRLKIQSIFIKTEQA